MTTDVFQKQRFGRSLGPGQNSALVIVDFVNGFADPNHFGGGNINRAIEATTVLLDAARINDVPVCFTRIVYQKGTRQRTIFEEKVPSLSILTEENPLSAVVPELSPRTDELVVAKQNPSSFFGTNLGQWLVGNRVQNLIVAGCTTSGCVRATVVDGMSYNYRCFVVESCVGDRSQASHDMSLFEMQQKYADVCSREQAIALFDGSKHPRTQRPVAASARSR